MSRLTRVALDAARNAAKVYWRTFNPISVGIQVIVRDEDDRILTVAHNYGHTELHFPGGGIHRRETLIEGMSRELEEETGLEVVAESTEIRLIGAYTNFAQGKSDHIALFELSPHQWRGTPERSGIEIAGIRWISADDPPPELAPGATRRLQELAGDREVDFEW